ncbi:MAG: hypothetical protein ACOC1K_02640 [Nanoarchaeota archaeon]
MLGFYIFYMIGFISSLLLFYCVFYEVDFRKNNDPEFEDTADIIDKSKNLMGSNPSYGIIAFTMVSVFSWVSASILSYLLYNFYIKSNNKE